MAAVDGTALVLDRLTLKRTPETGEQPTRHRGHDRYRSEGGSDIGGPGRNRGRGEDSSSCREGGAGAPEAGEDTALEGSALVDTVTVCPTRTSPACLPSLLRVSDTVAPSSTVVAVLD
ncbi:hypothetical protein, partial [Rhodococcus wratislaviensis]|uniref:hypothetical protein n=1 Tax=Rhodococcus wratislaviensis TaxID=44752 RepID=UPI00366662F6